MSCTVEIQTETATDVLTVPIQAVTTRIAKDSLDKLNEKNQKTKDEGFDKVTYVSTKKKSDEVKECVFKFVNGLQRRPV